MPNSVLLEPVTEDDPCGPDMRWDTEYQTLSQLIETLVNQDATVADAEVAGGPQQSIEDIIFAAEDLSRKTKDIGVLAIYAEACWRDQGLAAFADAMTDIVAMIEQWADADAGIHPRADPEDGDLSERAAPLGRLLFRVPSLAATVGWGRKEPEISERVEVAKQLQAIFGEWKERLEVAFGPQLPSKEDAWSALSPMLGGADIPIMDEEGVLIPGAEAQQMVAANPWDLIERAAELMEQQERHSPALPILRLMATWRDKDIVEIMAKMSSAGLQLEQVLQSMKQQTAQ